MGPPSRELTEVFCRVPSTSFSQAPWYALPVHLCRFRVRSHGGLFPGTAQLPDQSDKVQQHPRSVTSSWPGTINPVPIDYASRPRLRPRLTQGGLAWPWNPWSSGGRVSHPSFATHACILTRATSTARSPCRFTGSTTLPYRPTHLHQPVNRPAGLLCESHSFGGVLEPRYIVGAEPLDQ